jgi:hypothetical protein
VARVPVTVTGTTDRTFVTAEHQFATLEMQLSGQALAESMGRLPNGYSRDDSTPNIYFTPVGTSIPGDAGTCTDTSGSYDSTFNSCPTVDRLRWIGRVLSIRVLQFYGRISYEVYLLHGMVVEVVNTHWRIHPFPRYVLVLAVTTVLGAISWRWFERPILGLSKSHTELG